MHGQGKQALNGNSSLRTFKMHCVGVDVSKATLDAALLTDEVKLKYKDKNITNTAAGHQQLLGWAVKQTGAEASQIHFILESSGVYGEELALFLCQAGAVVSVVNPGHVRAFAKGLGILNKSDRLDARVLARFGQVKRPPPFVPPAAEVLELKAMLARLDALDADLQRERNRLEKTQAVSSTPARVVGSIARSIAFIEKEKINLEKAIDDHIDSNPKLKTDRQLLESIPAVGRLTAWRMLSVIHSKSFKTASQLAAYLGLVPIVHQSGSSVSKPPRLSKAGNARFRAALYMPAVVAKTHNPDVQALYERLLSSGMAKLAAICAAMRKLVHICFGVIKHQKPYQSQVQGLKIA
jgi:transposase